MLVWEVQTQLRNLKYFIATVRHFIFFYFYVIKEASILGWVLPKEDPE